MAQGGNGKGGKQVVLSFTTASSSTANGLHMQSDEVVSCSNGANPKKRKRGEFEGP